jgi:hypothetical protein
VLFTIVAEIRFHITSEWGGVYCQSERLICPQTRRYHPG